MADNVGILSEQFDLSLHCLCSPICANSLNFYDCIGGLSCSKLTTLLVNETLHSQSYCMRKKKKKSAIICLKRKKNI